MSSISDLYAAMNEHRALLKSIEYEYVACNSSRRIGELVRSASYHARNIDQIQAEIDAIIAAERQIKTA